MQTLILILTGSLFLGIVLRGIYIVSCMCIDSLLKPPPHGPENPE